MVPTWEHVDAKNLSESRPSQKHTFTKKRDRMDVEYDKGKFPKRKSKQTIEVSGRNPFQNVANKSIRNKRGKRFV